MIKSHPKSKITVTSKDAYLLDVNTPKNTGNGERSVVLQIEPAIAVGQYMVEHILESDYDRNDWVYYPSEVISE